MSNEQPERYSAQLFPAYRHRPGQTPHPQRDPRGHSYGRASSSPAPIDPTDWARCDSHLYAVDLFNHGYWWEAHEVWEDLWRGFERGDPNAHVLQGLILLAAAELKREGGLVRAARSLGHRAVERLREGEPPWLGIDAADLLAQTQAGVAGPLRIRLCLEARPSHGYR